MTKPNPFWKDKVVLVTGSSRGIGKKTVRALLERGARVVLNGRDERSLALAFEEMKPLGIDRVHAVVADVSRFSEAQRLVCECVERFGKLDVVVNNAGLSMRGRFEDLEPSVVETILHANVSTAVYTTRAAYSELKKTRGRALFVSSLAGVRGFAQVSIYSAAKMALTALVESLSAEGKSDRIRFGIAYLAFTENDQEKTILASDGRTISHQRSWQMTQERTALAILRAVESGRRKTVLTFVGKIFVFLQNHFPSVVGLFVGNDRGGIHSIQERT